MKKQPFRIEWTAHAYEHKERSSDWFWAVGIITVSVAIAAIIFGNVIFGILVILATFSLSLFINRLPETVVVIIDEGGVMKDKTYYPYESLESFWLDAEHSHPKILLRSTKFFIPLIVAPLGQDVDPEKVRDALSLHLKEEPHTLPFLENLLEYLGF